MSLLGKVYLLVSLGLVVLGMLWAMMTLRDNPAWVPVTLWIPGWTPEGLWQARHYDVSASALLAGWFALNLGIRGWRLHRQHALEKAENDTAHDD